MPNCGYLPGKSALWYNIKHFSDGLFGNSAGNVRFYQVKVPFLAPLRQFPLFTWAHWTKASFANATFIDVLQLNRSY